MGTCQSCGGILGRDCFNPVECQWISERMAAEQEALRMEEYQSQMLEEHVSRQAQEHINKMAAEHEAKEAGFDPISLGM